MKGKLFLFIGMMIAFYVLLKLQLNLWLVFVLILLATFGISFGYPIFITYRSKSIRMIDRFIVSNHSKPLFGYAHALAYGSKEDVIQSLKRIIASYPQAEVQEIYKANLAFYQKDTKKLREVAQTMASPDFKNYYSGLAAVLKKDLPVAEELAKEIRTPWTYHSLQAAIAWKRKDEQQFRQEADKAVQHAVGMQRYVIFHTMKRLEEGKV
ncbi:hypothetical protein [Sporosarcina cyprini]|uniref:hypothetical protein n=1 Tax=Sporosarcina cyprini TaxID=2910523 RepID=UPI001EDEEDCD|nr:hypothetical protein [Sporosarcina cyprini]MCG3087058.1 hypothetical protein [Sporosarcina cyprini]